MVGIDIALKVADFRWSRGTIAIMELLVGSINAENGIYKNHCCGGEIVLFAGIMFPNCKKHHEITTRWSLVGTLWIGQRGKDVANDGSSKGGASAA
jgi:hypothetical protein